MLPIYLYLLVCVNKIQLSYAPLLYPKTLPLPPAITHHHAYIHCTVKPLQSTHLCQTPPEASMDLAILIKDKERMASISPEGLRQALHFNQAYYIYIERAPKGQVCYLQIILLQLSLYIYLPLPIINKIFLVLQARETSLNSGYSPLSQLISCQMTPENGLPLPGQFFSDPSNNSEFACNFHDSPLRPAHEDIFYFPFQDLPISIADSASSHGGAMVKEEEEAMNTSESQQLQESPLVEVGGLGRREKLKGMCNCKKNNCQDKYCECFKAGRMCTDKCGCRKCKQNKYHRHLFCDIEDFSDRFYDFKHNIKKK